MSRTRLITLTAVAASAALLALAAPASAHVTVSSTDATQGGYAVVAVRVPTESDTASTTKVELQMPTATPFAYVGVQATPGWTDATSTEKLATALTNDDGDKIDSAISTVTWTAGSGAAIKPGHFQQFFLQVGPLPKASTVTFKALQTYSDGSVVKWIETAAPGSTTEPDHPAPVLTLAPAASTGASASAAEASRLAGQLNSGKLPLSFTKADTSSNTGPVVLSIVALVVAVAALAFGVVSRAKGRREQG